MWFLFEQRIKTKWAPSDFGWKFRIFCLAFGREFSPIIWHVYEFNEICRVYKSALTNQPNANKFRNRLEKNSEYLFVDLGHTVNTFVTALFWIFIRWIRTVGLSIAGKRNMYARTVDMALELMITTRNWIQSLQFI